MSKPSVDLDQTAHGNILIKVCLVCYSICIFLIYEPRHEKTNLLVSNLGRHKPGCTATEDGLQLEISDLESRGIVPSM